MTSESMPGPPEDSANAGSPGPVLFPRLGPEQYKARLLRYLYILMRLIFVGMFVAAVWWISGAMGTVLVPLLASFILAYLLNPLIDRFQAHGIGRRTAIAICLAITVVLIGLVALFVIPPVIKQVGELVARLPKLVHTVQYEWVPWIEQRFRTQLPESVRQAVGRYGSQAASALPNLTQRAVKWAVGAVSTTGHALFMVFNLVLIPVFTYYFLQRFGRLKVAVANWLPVRRREFTLSILRRMDEAVGEWFRGQVEVAIIVGILYAVGLSIAFGLAGIDIKLGIAIGIVSGMLNIIPYFGMIVAIALTLLVVLLGWPGWAGVLGVVIVFIVNHILEAYVVAPKVIGDKVDINPVAVIILLLIGGEFAGIWGILLIVPIAGAIKVIIPDLLAIYQETAFYHGGVVSEGDTRVAEVTEVAEDAEET